MTFDYKNPTTWQEKYPSCRLPNQSPININTDGSVSIPYCKLRCAVDFIYNNVHNKLKIVNYKKYVAIEPVQSAKDFIVFNDERFNLDKIVIKIPSEHKISNTTYDGELQFHHTISSQTTLDRNRKVIVSVFLTINDTQPANELLKATFARSSGIPSPNNNNVDIPIPTDNTVRIGGPYKFSSLLPKNKSFFTYLGSLTEPDCLDNAVNWIILDQTINVHTSFKTYILSKVDKKVHNGVEGMQIRTIESANPGISGGFDKTNRLIFYNNNGSDVCGENCAATVKNNLPLGTYKYSDTCAPKPKKKSTSKLFFNYVKEIKNALKSGGALIAFITFLMIIYILLLVYNTSVKYKALNYDSNGK